jgi:thiamine pyrophosphate-dependent acetolactate synthase large subunit-like protein
MAASTVLPTGAEVLMQCLIRHGVEVVFAYPGGAALPILQALTQVRGPIRTFLPRHEQGGGFAAVGYARSSGRVGVCVATSGPGATNLVPCLVDAQRGAVPLLAVTGQANRRSLGTDAFQEIPIVSLCRAVTKHHALVTRAADLPRVLAEALHVATTGRPGPVLVDVPKDVQNERFAPAYDAPPRLPGYRPEAWTAPDLPSPPEQADAHGPEEVVARLWRLVRARGQLDQTILTSGFGPAAKWVARGYRFPGPRHWVRSDSLGAVGFALPAALGAQAAHPDRQVIAVDTPDGFLSHVQELACAFCERLPVKVLLLDSEDAGTVRYPDAAALARGFRASARSVGAAADLDNALAELLDARGPALLEVRPSACPPAAPIRPERKIVAIGPPRL